MKEWMIAAVPPLLVLFGLYTYVRKTESSLKMLQQHADTKQKI
jgi:hypothetical protein